MKANRFKELEPCLEYIYNNFGEEVFFSGRLSAYVLDLGPSIEEYSVIRLLEKENILNQIETIGSLDINDRNLLVNDIIYKLPVHLNKDAFKSTLEVIILSLGIDLGGNNKTQKDTPLNTSTHNSQNISSIANINTNAPKSNMYDDDMEPLDEESKQIIIELFKDKIDEEVDNILKNTIISETPPSEFEFDKNTGTIVKYLGTSKEITIPEKIQGIPVKIIGDSSFKDIGIEKINIPFGIEKIGARAFENNKIETLNIPDSVKSIGKYAFCENQINDLTLDQNIEFIGDFAFSENKIETISIPNSVKSIGNRAFSENQINDLTLGQNIELIGIAAFCENKIQTLSIPDSVKFIGRYAFWKNQINDLTLDQNIELIGNCAFSKNNIEN
uniref:leucine-rich repeat domain-containing protein n=1 Tax=uncultured Helcococcus sp. TaxID=1072508 RepID=UPI00261C0C34